MQCKQDLNCHNAALISGILDAQASLQYQIGYQIIIHKIISFLTFRVETLVLFTRWKHSTTFLLSSQQGFITQVQIYI